MTAPLRPPAISICIANYNGEHLLDECLNSIRSQRFSHALEIIVHDDASSDNSLRVLAECHPDVIVIASRQNVGYCRSNNRMAAEARGTYLLLLNNDATLRPNALSILFAAAEQEAGPFAFSLPQYDHATGALVDRGVRLDLLHTPVANRLVGCSKLAYVQAACMLVARRTWNELGGFPEWMESNAEDTYFCAIVRLAGGRISVIEGSGYDHRQGISFGGNRSTEGRLSTTYRRRYLSERNRAGMILVCTPTALAWLLYGIQISALILEGTLVAIASADTRAWTDIYWRSFLDSIGMLGELKKSRTSVQSQRKIGPFRYLSVIKPVLRKVMVLIKRGIPKLE